MGATRPGAASRVVTEPTATKPLIRPETIPTKKSTHTMPSTRGQLGALFGRLDRGVFVTTYLNEAKRWRSACWSPDRLDDAARWCAERDAEGHNVYVRVTSLAGPVASFRRGTTDQTDAVIALCGDLDVAGPGHADSAGLPLPPDLGAVRAILNDVGITPTMTVHTGGGLHVWWLLEEPWYLDSASARATAVNFVKRWGESLVELGPRRGFHVDDVGDLTRVLRVCGTHRYKPNVTPNLVTLDHCGVWPAIGLASDPQWRPGPLYTLDQLEAHIVQPEVRPRAGPGTGASTTPRSRSSSSRYGPANAVSDSLTWADILEPDGWTFVRNSTIRSKDSTTVSPVELWRRSGGSSEFSAKCSPDGWCIVWSSAAGLPSGPGRRLTKWRVFCHLRHHGDEVAAAREILALKREYV